jgi:hypothetical protein
MIGYIFNWLIYYFGWFLCVYLGGQSYSLTASGIALILLGGQLGLTFFQNRPLFHVDVRLSIVALILGVFMEMGFMRYGLLKYHEVYAYFPPLWLTTLYPLFAVTLNHSLKWLSKYPFLAFILGGIGAPLSYRAGVALHALVIPPPEVISLVKVGTVWGIYLTLIIYVNRSFCKNMK